MLWRLVETYLRWAAWADARVHPADVRRMHEQIEAHLAAAAEHERP